jgi:hypothetical protein
MTAIVPEPRVTLDLSALAGTWKNTNTVSRGVVRLDIAAGGNELRITAHAAESWGSTIAHAYLVDVFDNVGRTLQSDNVALAFNATFDLGIIDVRLQANIKAGVLVVAFLTRFHDDSGRSNYFTREFYYRSAA